MSARRKELEDKVRKLSTKALEVVEDDRPWSEKSIEVEKYETDIKATQAELADVRAVEEKSADFKALSGAGDDNGSDSKSVLNGSDPERPAEVKSIGEQFVESDGFKSIASQGGRFSTGPVDVKATFTTAAGGAGVMQPQYISQPVPILFKRLVVADLMPSGPLDANRNSLIYPVESSVTNAAATVAEGAAKPASDLNLTNVTELLHKIATTLKVSDEMVQDYGATMSYVNGRLLLFVRLTEEDELLNGSGSGTHLTGLLNRSGKTAAQALGSDTAPDAIYKEITKIRTTAFIEPDGIVINPANWQTIRLGKDANGQYYAGGPFTGAYGNGSVFSGDSLWGLPVVITPSIAAGTALVGAFQQCTQVFRRGGLTVEMTNSNEDDFLKNLVAIRAEERLLLAVYRPAGLGTVTGLL